MIEIKEIKSRRDFKKFVRFPNEIYKDCPYYVPPIELDEYNLTNPKKNASFEESDAVYFLAYKDGKIVGRIAGIISHAYNKKNNAKIVWLTGGRAFARFLTAGFKKRNFFN